jgi:hypothetical protein
MAAVAVAEGATPTAASVLGGAEPHMGLEQNFLLSTQTTLLSIIPVLTYAHWASACRHAGRLGACCPGLARAAI